jgi:hypothetical protein
MVFMKMWGPVVSKRKKRSIIFFVEVQNPFTNRVVADALAEHASESEERAIQCSDGIHRNLYECSRQIIRALYEMHDANLRFKAFVRQGKGKIYPAQEFLFVKRIPRIKSKRERATRVHQVD